MTSSWLALPPRALALAVASHGDDPDLPRGTHLRLLPGPDLGWPVAPLAVWRLPARSQDETVPWWIDMRGRPLAGAASDLDAFDGELFAHLWGQAPVPEATRIGVELLLPPGAQGILEVLDGADRRLLARRSASRWLIGSPLPRQVRVVGQGLARLRTWWLDEAHASSLLQELPPVLSMSLPLDQDLPWYAGAQGRDAALRRVAESAPLRYTLPDRPDGPFDALTDGDEVQRVRDFSGRLDELVYLVARDPDTHPFEQSEARNLAAGLDAQGRPTPWTEVRGSLVGELQLSMVDPGAARYLGLMGWLPDVPDDGDPVGHPSGEVLLIGGVFACPPDGVLASQPPDAAEERLLRAWMHREPGLGPVVLALRERGYRLRVQLAPAMVAPLPDRPDPPQLVPGPAHWLLPDLAGPDTAVSGHAAHFQRAVWLNRVPLCGPLAVAWQERGAWRSRHRVAGPSGRAAVRIAGQRLAHQAVREAAARVGVLEEAPLPEAGDGGAPWRCRVALSDLFGRYGDAAELLLEPPERPPVPKPALRAEVQSLVAEPDVEPDPPQAGPWPPGQLTWQVPVPTVAEMAGGALPLVALHFNTQALTGDGLASLPPQATAGWRVDMPPGVGPGTLMQWLWALPALLPGERGRIELTARFEDSAGRLGPAQAVAVSFADGRAPEVPPSGLGLMWTAQPGPGAEVQVQLRLPGRPGERWRAYLAGERALDPNNAQGDPDAPPRARAVVAEERRAADWAPSAERDRYRLLGDAPLEVEADGWARLEFSLPRSLQSVQFLSLVPVSTEGREAGFASALRLAIAVPSDRRPPAPRVWAEVNRDTGQVSLGAVAEGLDLALLRVTEPGLFADPPSADARAPRLRWRRAAGALCDPDLARGLTEQSLHWNGEQFTAEFMDFSGHADAPDPCPSYLPLHYWAELRFPAERRLPAGWAQEPWPSAGVQPAHPRQLEDAPGPWSRASAPVTVMRVPAEPPSLDLDRCLAQAVVEGDALRLTASLRGPALPQRSSGRFEVAVAWEHADGQRSPLGTPQPLALDGTATWSALVSGRPQGSDVPVALWLTLTDPLGRSALAQRLPVVP